MVLGLRSKGKITTSVQLDYTIEVLEIKPWPASQSLKSIRSLVLQWENGDKNFGFTSSIYPSLAEGKVEINESFRLQVTLMKEMLGRGNGSGNFQKNILHLHLHESKKGKAVKGQPLASAGVDLAQHALVRDSLKLGIPVTFKRSFRNIAQPVLYVKIQSVEKTSPGSSSRENLSKRISLDKDGRDSVSALMSEEYANEDDIASFTDDDVSSHSSMTNSSSIVENNAELLLQSSPEEKAQVENVSETSLKEESEEGQAASNSQANPAPEESDLELAKQQSVCIEDSIKENDSSARFSPVRLSIKHKSVQNSDFDLPYLPRGNLEATPNKSGTPTANSLSSDNEAAESETGTRSIINGKSATDLHQEHRNLVRTLTEGLVSGELLKEQISVNSCIEGINTAVSNSHSGKINHDQILAKSEKSISNVKSQESRYRLDEVPEFHLKPEESFKEENFMANGTENDEVQSTHFNSSPESFSIASVNPSIEHAPSFQRHERLTSGVSVYSGRVLRAKGNEALLQDRSKSMSFSVRSPPHALGSNGYANANQCSDDEKEIGVLEDVSSSTALPVSNTGAKDFTKSASRFQSRFFDNKVHELECRVEMLEGELREAAAIEIGLYSVVAEHGSSVHKVHTPARRLSRLYLHSSKPLSGEKRARAARSAVSGLILVAKACGNDIPRLTFWLSNSVVLRAIVSNAIAHSERSNSLIGFTAEKGSAMIRKEKTIPLKWESVPRQKEKFSFSKERDDWEDPQTFMVAVEKIESWIFSRIVDSVWWQIFTPYMQSSNESYESKSPFQWRTRFERECSRMDDSKQNSYSFEIWKKAFQDACERLCPVRAEGHECGCLLILSKLVMEQCVARLDVAMFNALLRDSDDVISTDPVADPINNNKVLPVPPGKSSFGVGALLKNAIGNWSRSLSDLFGLDDDDYSLDKNDEYDERIDATVSLKSFRLLNALSDLYMLPKDMLLEKEVRKEVCPTFSSSVLVRILSSFMPDEFCPDLIPVSVFEALDSEDLMVSGEDGIIRNIPCNASPISYSPPSVSSVENVIGDVQSKSQLRRGSSLICKCQADDDELEELDSPLSAIIFDKSSSPIAKANMKTSASPFSFRYQLLRDLWKIDD